MCFKVILIFFSSLSSSSLSSSSSSSSHHHHILLIVTSGERAVKIVVEKVSSVVDHLDVLINNAGLGCRKSSLESTAVRSQFSDVL